MYYEDLSRCGLFDEGLAVGWLMPARAYSRGTVPRGFLERLTQLLEGPWEPASFCGGLYCRFCEGQQGYSAQNVFVPGRDAVYVAPEGILHYISAHDYRPPDQFIEAVLACPSMSSFEYFDALARLGFLRGDPRLEWEAFVDAQRKYKKFLAWKAAGSPGTLRLD